MSDWIYSIMPSRLS